MKIYLVIFLFSLLELSCKSRSGHLESENPVIRTKSDFIAAMKNFELGQKVIQEMVPKLQNGEKFEDYKPYPFVKISIKHEAANQAFSPENFREEGNLLEDIRRDTKYFAHVGQDTSGNNLSMLETYRKPFLGKYNAPGNGKILLGKLFIPETSIKSDEFFDFFMGILDQEHKQPNDKIVKSEIDQFKVWETGVIRSVEGPYPRAGVFGINGYDLILKNKTGSTISTFTYDKLPRFLYLAKDKCDHNPQWFENKNIPTSLTSKQGIYIPYLGENKFEYNKLPVFEAKDLSHWIKIASNEIFALIDINNLPDSIKIYSKQTVPLAKEDTGSPVYYLDSDGKLKPLTKEALEKFKKDLKALATFTED